VGKVVVLLTTVVLTRLLAPEQFGLVALALVMTTYAQGLADAGVAQALVYLPRSAATDRAALFCSTVLGALLALLGVLVAPALADFFHQPDLVPLVRLLALSLLTGAIGAVPEALLRRSMRFRRLTAATVVRSLTTGVVSIGLAFAGFGAWALAWGVVAGSVIYSASTWALLQERPDCRIWRISGRELRRLLAYGIPAASSSLLAGVVMDVDYLIIGQRLGAEALGYYTLAFRIPELLIMNVFYVISSVTFPLYSSARADQEGLRRTYALSVRMQSLYGLCAGIGIAVVAPLIVPIVFGEAWQGAIAPLIALSLYAACRSLGVGSNDVYKALGRPGVSVKISLLRLAILVPVLIVATRWGITGVAWAQAATSLLFVLLMQAVACRLLKMRGTVLLAAVSPALMTGAAVAITGGLLAQVPITPPAALTVAVVGGLVAAATVLHLGYRGLLNDIISLVRRPPSEAPA